MAGRGSYVTILKARYNITVLCKKGNGGSFPHFFKSAKIGEHPPNFWSRKSKKICLWRAKMHVFDLSFIKIFACRAAG